MRSTTFKYSSLAHTFGRSFWLSKDIIYIYIYISIHLKLYSGRRCKPAWNWFRANILLFDIQLHAYEFFKWPSRRTPWKRNKKTSSEERYWTVNIYRFSKPVVGLLVFSYGLPARGRWSKRVAFFLYFFQKKTTTIYQAHYSTLLVFYVEY